MKKIICLFAVAVLELHCSPEPVGPKLGEQFHLEFGAEVTLQDQGITIKFKTVESDSRCPQSGICKWAGNAKVVLEVSEVDIALNTHLDPKFVAYSNKSIQLIALNPPPRLTGYIEPREYVATILVTKK